MTWLIAGGAILCVFLVLSLLAGERSHRLDVLQWELKRAATVPPPPPAPPAKPAHERKSRR